MRGNVFMTIRDVSEFVENAPSRNVEESLERFLDPDPQTEKFDNLTSFSPDRCLPVCEL